MLLSSGASFDEEVSKYLLVIGNSFGYLRVLNSENVLVLVLVSIHTTMTEETLLDF
jgi:hypothetical protein